MYEIGTYMGGVKAGLEIAARISAEFGEKHYPEDIFPQSKAAEMGRRSGHNIAREIERYILANMLELEEPPS